MNDQDEKGNCPCCHEETTLHLLTKPSKETYLGCACVACGCAHNEKGEWTFYAGGMKYGK